LKSAASLSSCRPSSPDIACHHMISVTARAGDESPMAATSTASCNHLEAGFTIGPSQAGTAEPRLREAARPSINRAGGFEPQGGRPRRNLADHRDAAGIAIPRRLLLNWLEPFFQIPDPIIGGPSCLCIVALSFGGHRLTRSRRGWRRRRRTDFAPPAFSIAARWRRSAAGCWRSMSGRCRMGRSAAKLSIASSLMDLSPQSRN